MEVELSNVGCMNRVGYPKYASVLGHPAYPPLPPPSHFFTEYPPETRITTDSSSCLSPLGRKTVMRNFKKAESERKGNKVMDTVKRKTRAVSPDAVRRRKQRRLRKNSSSGNSGRSGGRRRSLSQEQDFPKKNFSVDESGESSPFFTSVFHWWSSNGKPPGSARREDLAEKLSFDEKKLFEITNASDRMKLGKAGQLVYLKRADHELLGTQFQQDDSGRMWILINFFKGSVPFSYREQDAIRSACGPTFSDMEVLVSFFENEAERETCGANCMTQVIVKMVKEEALTSGSLIYEPK